MGINDPRMTMGPVMPIIQTIPQTQQNQMSKDIQEMKEMLEKLNKNCEIMKKSMGSKQESEEYEQLNQKYKKLKQDSENTVELQMKCDNLQKKLKQQNQQSEDDEAQIKKHKQSISNLEVQLRQQKTDAQNNLQQLQQDYDNYIKKIQLLSQNDRTTTNNSQLFQDHIEELSKQIKKLKAQNAELTEQNQQLQASDKQHLILDLQLQINKLKNEVDTEHENFNQKLDVIAEQRKKIQAKDKDIKIKDESISSLNHLYKDTSLKLKQKEQQIKYLDELIQQKDAYTQQLNTYINKLKDQMLNQSSPVEIKINQALIDEMSKLQEKQEAQKRKQEEDKQKLQDELDRKANQLRQIQEKEIQEQEENRNQKIQRAEILRKKMQESHGQMEVCFLVDCTGSMDSYKQQTMMSISGSMQAIKKETGRDVKWSTVCYQDYEEKAALPGNLYQQLNFTKKPEELEQFLNKISCTGGGDAAEDIRGGIIQMCQKISWDKPFRLAILICDAPTHGVNTNGSCGDNHPNDDIRDAILMMIKLDIMFVGLNFTRYTKTMYTYIEQIFIEHKRQDLFTFVNMDGVKSDSIWKEMITKILEATVAITKTNKKETKSKGENPTDAPKTKDGAIEALCNAGNFYDFEKQNDLKIVDAKFKVIRVDIKEDSFKKKLEDIHQIKVPEDYEVNNEGHWDCIRTEKPFAFGMMKEVYLMKKKNATQELYVIKTPLGGKTYSTLNDAITECRSHLVCQKLMKKFIKEVNDACEEAENNGQQVKQYPQIVYSDFLILEENPKSFWIAERFFKGEFIKYNNNYGYINDEQTQLNQMAQAFSYYTFHVSNFNYMVNDVQGVSKYFTDPAINTQKGDFDQTDMGEGGQSMFMVNFQAKKSMCIEILRLIKIYQTQTQTQT